VAHSLILGTTESGKTELATRLVAGYRKRGISSLVLDPIGDARWTRAGAVFQTREPEHFLEVVRRSTSCAVFVDEAGEAVGQFDRERWWLATRARHLGHASHFLAQRASMVSPNIRGQCRHLFLFLVPLPDAKELASDWCKPELIQGASLGQGDYLHANRFAPVTRLNLWRNQPVTNSVAE
jgi:hypothetical protein